MNSRRETSVMASLREILHDRQHREEQEQLAAERRAREEAERRLDDARRKQQAEAERVRAEHEERERRAFEEKRRQAELDALQAAALQRVRMEAESQARLGEMTARQEHERQLHALAHDRRTRRLRAVLVMLGVVMFGGAIAGGLVIKRQLDAAARADAQARDLRAQVDDAVREKSRLQDDLQRSRDPAEIERLQRELRDQGDMLDRLRNQRGPAAKSRLPADGTGAARPPKAAAKTVCNCIQGDPMCTCL